MGRIWTNGSGIPINASNLNGIENDIGRAVKPWTPNTSYGAGQAVVDPTGDVVTATTAHTSGTSYTPANWSNPTAVFATGPNVYPDGSADSTTGIQAAINIAVSNGLKEVIIPGGFYRVDGTLLIQGDIAIRGAAYHGGLRVGSGQGSTTGTVLYSNPATAGTGPVIQVTPTSSDASTYTWLYGFAMSDITILGALADNATFSAREGLQINAVASEWHLDRVNIFRFAHQGLRIIASQDGVINGVRVLSCGTGGTYPGVGYETSASGVCNAIHAVALHVEGSQTLLQITGANIDNQFIGCKFEKGSFAAGPEANGIVVDSSGGRASVTFSACHFTNNSADDLSIYASATVQMPFFHITGANNTARIGNSDFTTGDTGSTQNGKSGTRWIEVLANARAIVNGNTIDYAWVGTSGSYAFALIDGCVFSDNIVWYQTRSATANLFSLGGGVNVHDNEFVSKDSTGTSSGQFFNVTGPNRFSMNHWNVNQVVWFQSGASGQRVTAENGNRVAAGVGSNFLDVSLAGPYASNIFDVNAPAATTITNFLGGVEGRTITLFFANANTTLSGAGTNFTVKGNASVTPAGAAIMVFYYDGSWWREVSRSF